MLCEVMQSSCKCFMNARVVRNVEYLISLCVQIPKHETVKIAENKITYIIFFKHVLELVELLCTALADGEHSLFKAYYEVLLSLDMLITHCGG